MNPNGRSALLWSALAASAVLGAPRSARALEVSLEENRAERGNIGYVDMHKVFLMFPQTHKAKESFAEIVRQAEDQVNLRKGELIAARADISRAAMELEMLEKTPIPVPPPPAPAASAPAPVSLSTAAAQTPSKDASALPLALNLPGMSTAALLVELPPAASTPTASGDAAAAAAAMGPTQAELAAAAAKAREENLLRLRDKLADKRKELSAKEEDFKKYQAQVEKNLLDLEGRRTEILLGKIYVIVQEVARESGVSVVIDKSQILYGQRTVDLTDKVVKKLEGLQL